MSKIADVYRKYQNFIENILFPVLLLLYPLTGIMRGIDVADTTYSLSNFQYFTTMDGTWMVATFLANAVGNLMMRFPMGNTLMGMYFYTALIQSVIALCTYRIMSKRFPVRIPAPLVFAGEWIALGLCWCPSTLLYNYLTYLFMTTGILLLYGAILKDDRKYYVPAGICLGVNVAVRMPNVVQMAFIVAVWYGAAVYGRRLQQVVWDTLWCILGYLAGFGVPFVAICVKYGVGAYPAMIQTMFAMTEKATDYKPASMITGMFGDYMTGLFWLVFGGVCMAGGWLLFTVQGRKFAGKRGAEILCKAIYMAVLLVLIRFYWGRGVFSFRYYEYGSMYYPAVLLLLVAIGTGVYCLVRKNVDRERKILAVLVLVQIFVTPLGSNNALYPIINNLFIVVPFMLWVVYGQWKECEKKALWNISAQDGGGEAAGRDQFVCKAAFMVLILFVFIQSVGFHLTFTFQDGIEGETRNTKLAAPDKVSGVYTNQDNGAWLEELAVYIENAGLTGQEVILYGEVPGLGYLLDMPSALSTFWPDLDSYRMVEYERDLARMDVPPVVITSTPIAAYLAEDADGMNWFGVDQEKMDGDEKLQMLGEYMREHSYGEVFGNGRYVVYVTE